MNFTLKIWRQKDAKSKGEFKTYNVENISADTSFLEMLDILNNDLVHKGEEPVAFDHDCREGICGMCSLHINGHAHGPSQAVTTCQMYMRKFKDGSTITIEPWTMYLRPYMFGSNPVIGVKPATEYQFRIFATPVGPYFKGGAKPLTLRVCDFDRAAPRGTGHIKAGLNYAMSLHAIVDAHNQGYDENMYLDSATRTKVEETGGANFIFVTKDGKLVTPKSETILPSITRRSLCYVAKEYLGMEVEEREVYLEEIKDFAECGLCGTAAVISPVGKVVDHGTEICFPSGMAEMGPVLKKLYDTLTGIQMGRLEAPEGWLREIKVK